MVLTICAVYGAITISAAVWASATLLTLAAKLARREIMECSRAQSAAA